MAANAALAPSLDVACTVCGEARADIVAAAGEIEAQRRHLRRFHRRRIEAPDAGGDALEERAEFTHDYATNVVACAACGLLYRDPRPPAAAIARAYAADEYGRERLEALYESQLELFRPKARALLRDLAGRSSPRIVEVGSFVGGFLAAARECGASVVGLDPGEEVAAFCAEKGLEVRRCTPEQAGVEAGSADCVAVWNTFDQLPRPGPTLAEIRRMLRPGGVLVIRVPSGACFARAMRAIRCGPPMLRPWITAAMSWNNLLSFPYLHGYTRGSLDRLLAAWGFARVGFRADVLTRLADARTKRWAAAEERLLKWLCLAAAQRDADLAPWFDATYRRGRHRKRGR